MLASMLLLAACCAADEGAAFRPLGVNQAGMLVVERPQDGARMIWIPAGPFQQNLYHGKEVKKPPHDIAQVHGFAIDETEVTNAQFCGFLNATGSTVDGDGRALLQVVESGMQQIEGHWRPAPGCEQLPALGVTGFGALAYAHWVGGDLPQLAEWQKAASGIEGRQFPWGNEPPTPAHANYRAGGPGTPTPVGSYPQGASAYGLLDMAGNVYERVWTGRGGRRAPVMIRGGSWASPHPLNLRTFDLCMQDLSVADRTVGFRCVVRQGAGLPVEPRSHLRLALSWKEARKQAQERNCPVLVLLHYDTCGQCDRAKVGLLADPEFIDYCNEHVVIVAGQHPWDAGTKPHQSGAGGACPFWPGLTCFEHMDLFVEMLGLVGTFRVSPGHYLITPHISDEAHYEERVMVSERDLPKWGGGASVYRQKIEECQQNLGEGLTYSEWAARSTEGS